jgi:predicted RNA binding protein YcfA (HicA-like mRNA interferase family)
MKGKDVINMLKKEGWEIKRITGSHYIMQKEGYRLVPVPYHSKDIKPGLLSAIAKQTGVKLP